MTKKDKVDLAIALSLGRSPLSKGCVEMLGEMTQADLVISHGLNENQAMNVMTWCKHESQRLFEVSFNVNKDPE